MTDRELLELASKAAGYAINPHKNYKMCRDLIFTHNAKNWNPLTDDGDALRLAVKLGLDVCIDAPNDREPHTHVIGFQNAASAETVDAIENHGDPLAATRRAITRAAAEIGRTTT